MPRRASLCGYRAVFGSALLLLVVAPVVAQIAPEPTGADVPVMVGDGSEMDACGSLAVVSGLDPNGANALSVRSGPGLGYARIATVLPGQTLWICGQEDRWYAVVYPKEDEDCGVSIPIDPKIAYAGPCLMGWVFEEFVTLVAG
jgi:hypothetical protein